MPRTKPEFRAPPLLNASSIASSDSWSDSASDSATTPCSRFADVRAESCIQRPLTSSNLRGKRFLVAPRGRTQWVRNAEAAGEVTLKKGSTRRKYRLRPLTPAEKPEILKAYLDAFRREVQRYFPVPAGPPLEAFAKLTESYPAFELQPV